MNIKINLLPDIIIQQRREARIKQMLDFAMIGWLVTLALIGVVFIVLVSAKNNKLENLTEEKTELNEVVNSEANQIFRLEASQVQRALDSISGLVVGKNKPSQMLETLARSMPESVTLQEITIGDSGLISLNGFAPSYDEVAQFLAGLDQSEDLLAGAEGLGYFESVSLQQAVASDVDQTTQSSFTINTFFISPDEIEVVDEAIDSQPQAEEDVNSLDSEEPDSQEEPIEEPN